MSTLPINAHLCHYCSKIIPIKHTEQPTRDFHPTLGSFRLQRGNCDLCCYIQNHLDEAGFDGSQYDEASLSLLLKEPNDSGHGVQWALLELWIRGMVSGRHRNWSRTFSVTTFAENSDNGRRRTTGPLSMADRAAVMKRWLHDCESNHGSHCRPMTEQTPKRLIEIGKAGTHCRLVSGDDCPVQARRYTTLSHCWGSQLPIRTIQSTVQSYSERIPHDMIPRTFRDAIEMTQALGISYLWIDALCIVQDSEEEWEQEAGKMKDIFSGSCLNIAACDASGSQEGCFAVSNATGKRFSVTTAEVDSLCLVKLDVGDTRLKTKDTILSSRGWVLQEQLLSHRMVSCMGDELHWECGETYKTSSGVQFEIHALDVLHLYQNVSIAQRQNLWRSWTMNFSKRDFTYWRDRLPAMAGIVQYHQRITKDTPLLGLWQSCVLEDLLWTRLSPISHDAVYDIRNAKLPSWSWLSCPAEIEFDFWQLTFIQEDPCVLVRDFTDLVDFAVTWTGSPFVSALEMAYIVINGPSIEITVEIDDRAVVSDPPYFKLGVQGESMPCSGQFDCGDIVPGPYTALFLRSRQHTQTKARRDIFLILEASSASVYRRVGIACVLEGTLLDKTARKDFYIQ